MNQFKSLFGIQDDPNAPLTPEELAQLSNQPKSTAPTTPLPPKPAPVKSSLQDPGLREAEAALAGLPESKPESQLERLERLSQELQTNRSKELEDANRRQMYQDILSGVNSNLGLIVGGAQAMNTKAAVTPAKAGEIKQRDFAKEVSDRYKGDQETMMEKYKALLKAQQDAAELAQKGKDGGSDWYKQAMIEERRADRQLREDMFKRGQDYREEKGDRLSDKQTGEIESLDNALYMVDRIETEKPKFNTGPIKTRAQGALSIVGIEDPEFAAFKARTLDTLSDYVKSKSGLQVTDAERKALEQVVPNASMDDDTFMATLKVFKERLADIRSRKVGIFQKQGKDSTPFAKSAAEPSASTGQFPRTVSRVDPSTGKTQSATVSNQAQLEEAMSEGFN